jgi:hypothetical protein
MKPWAIAFPCRDTVAHSIAFNSFTVAGAAPGLHRLPVSLPSSFARQHLKTSAKATNRSVAGQLILTASALGQEPTEWNPTPHHWYIGRITAIA